LAALENNVLKSGTFLAAQNCAFSDHNSPQSHHKFTIKKPRSTPHFFQNPHKKRPPNLKKQFDGRFYKFLFNRSLTAGSSNKPAHSTDRDTHKDKGRDKENHRPAVAAEDSAAASAAATPEANQPQAGSTPPGTPS
jgi:hypothetical protein